LDIYDTTETTVFRERSYQTAYIYVLAAVTKIIISILFIVLFIS